MSKGSSYWQKGGSTLRDKDIMSAMSGDERILAASVTGRILQASASMRAFLGFDPSGRSLDEILGEGMTMAIHHGLQRGGVYEFDCKLRDRQVSCGAAFSTENRMMLVFSLIGGTKIDKDEESMIEIISREINANVDNLSIILSALRRSDGRIMPAAMGLVQKSIYDLARMSRNITSLAEGAKGETHLDKRSGDLNAAVAGVCRKAAVFCEGFADIIVTDEGPVVSWFDDAAVKRLFLNLLAYCISGSACERPIIEVRTERRETLFVATVRAQGPWKEEQTPLARGTEMELVNTLVRAHSGSFITTVTRDGGRVMRITLPIESSYFAPDLSSPVVDWYGGMDIVAVELSGVLPPEAYERIWKEGRR